MIEVETIAHLAVWRATLNEERTRVSLFCRTVNNSEITLEFGWCQGVATGQDAHPAHIVGAFNERLTDVIATLTVMLCDILCGVESN